MFIRANDFFENRLGDGINNKKLAVYIMILSHRVTREYRCRSETEQLCGVGRIRSYNA